MEIGEVTTPSPRHQDFLADLIAAIKYENFSSTLTCCQRTKKARCATPYDNTINAYYFGQRPHHIQLNQVVTIPDEMNKSVA